MPDPSKMILDILNKEKMTQRQFADHCKISRQFLNDVICGRKPLSLFTAIRIEAAMPDFDSRAAMIAQFDIVHKQMIKMPARA